MCKLEHYGNCDPETKDQEYCIFHKPNKNEEEARKFWRKFLERFKPKELEVDEETVEGYKIGKVKYLVFECNVNCKGFVFPDSKFLLERSVFKKFANFSEAVFEGNALFNLAKFEHASFDKAIFKKDARFFGAIFGNANFREVCFEGIVDFKHAKFKRADFTYAKFKGKDNWFTFAEFGQAYFGEAEFGNFVWFTSAKFGYSHFILTKFGKYTNFSCAIFYDTVIFDGSTFNGETYFKETIFRGITSFRDVTFLQSVDFSGKLKDEKYKFYKKLSFSGAEFKKGVKFLKYINSDDEMPSDWFRLPQAEAEACRVLRLYYEKEGNKDKADGMFLREKRALRRAKVRQVKEQLNKSNGVKSKLKALINLFKAYTGASIEFILADLTCEYGTNWIKPIVLWIFTVLMLFPLLYLVTNSIPNAYDFLSCLYFSIVTATTLGYGDLHPVGIGRTIASAEAIFGTFMWAVFLAVFARKYMR